MAGVDDPQIQKFMEIESHKQRFKQIVHSISEECWDTCFPGALSKKMDGKTESCIINCVNRFLDASNFIVTRLEEDKDKYVNREASEKFS